MFDCVITVKGNGKGENGRFKHDKTGPVSQFMVDNTYLYPVVKQHVVACPHCDPTEVLRHYLQRRLTLAKFQPKPGAPLWNVAGQLTGSLAKLALSYERKCAKTRPVPAALVNEFIWRTASVELLTEFGPRLSVRELVNGAEMLLARSSGTRPKNVLAGSKLDLVLQLLQHHAKPETEQEFEDLIAVAEVQIV